MDKDHIKHIKAIIFDWGGVCCAEAEPFASLDLQNVLRKTPEQIAEAVRPIYNAYYKGAYTGENFWKAVLQYFKVVQDEHINPEALSAAYKSSYKIYPEIFDAISKLRGRYRVGLLSNLTPEMRDHIRLTHELDKYFDEQVYSCDSDIAMMKPDAAIFHNILYKMKLLPKETLFIDNSRKNIEAAAELGMHTIFFENKEQCLRDLKEFI